MPDKIGKYELRGVLGRGAMGTVLDGWDPAIERRVAIKTVRLADAAADEEAAEALERFKREAQAAGRLSHANIVGVFDTGETEELAYIVMEFIEGRSLKQVLDTEKSLPPDEAAEIMSQVLAGLDYSHRRGVVHRDIKPANIMLTTDGGVKIADFGIARLSSSTATAVGSILGTPAYMPPEQFLGEPADARSDIFAAGAMLFHLLTGTRPYEGNATSIMTRVLNADAPPLPSARSVSVSPAWDQVILRAMAKKPEDRFQSAAEFSQAVKAALAAPALAAQDAEADATMVQPAKRPSQVKAPPPAAIASPPAKIGGVSPALLAGGGLAVAAIAAGAWFFLSPQGAPPTASPKPKPEQVVAMPPPPPQQPPMTAPPKPSPEAVRDTLSAAAAGIPCSFVQAGLGSGSVTLQGIAGAGAAHDALDQRAHSASLPVTADIQAFADSYCPALDVLLPVLRTSELDVISMNKPGPVRADQLFLPSIRNLPFGAWLQVDYLSGDKVFHVLPTNADRTYGTIADPLRFLPAGTTINLGQGTHNPLQPSPPFGTDMLIATASSEKLFAHLRPQNEDIAQYAQALKAAIDQVKKHGGQVASGVLLVQTADKP
jgi:serine/threonine-protein kinase